MPDYTSKLNLKKPLGNEYAEIEDINQNMQTIDDALGVKIAELDETGNVPVNQLGNAPSAPVQSVNSKTGDVVLVKADVGLSNVDNTSDASKPVSTAVQTALNGKAASSHNHSAANITSGILEVLSRYHQVADTRNINRTPQEILNLTNGGFGVWDFKANTTDGLNDGGTYHVVLTIKKYQDLSGGNYTQVAFTDNGNIWIRQSASSTTWTSWTKIINASNNLSDLTNVATARSNLGLTGTSNTTHYHDSRYVQTRIYNGELQYYDGGWKSTSAVKSVQTGYTQIGKASYITGTGEDLRYVNVTISAVNINKCQIYGNGGFGNNVAIAFKKSAGATDSYEASMRLTNSTTLRISVPAQYDVDLLALRWTVIEYT